MPEEVEQPPCQSPREQERQSPEQLSKGWTAVALTAVFLPPLTAELMTHGILPLGRLLSLETYIVLVVTLYLVPFPLAGFVYIVFPRSAYKFERFEEFLKRKIPLLGRLCWRALPTEPKPRHLLYIRLLGVVLLSVPVMLLLLFIYI